MRTDLNNTERFVISGLDISLKNTFSSSYINDYQKNYLISTGTTLRASRYNNIKEREVINLPKHFLSLVFTIPKSFCNISFMTGNKGGYAWTTISHSFRVDRGLRIKLTKHNPNGRFPGLRDERS